MSHISPIDWSVFPFLYFWGLYVSVFCDLWWEQGGFLFSVSVPSSEVNGSLWLWGGSGCGSSTFSYSEIKAMTCVS